MTKISIFLLSLSCLFLAACSSSILFSKRENNIEAFIDNIEAKNFLAKKAVCCRKFSELKFLPINNETSLFVALTSQSQTYQFKSGKSFVQAYKLNNHASKLRISADSLIYDNVLAPQIILLDANFNITRTIKADSFIYKKANMLIVDRLSAEITIYRPQLDNPANETYLLFYTTDEAISGSTTILHPAKAFAIAQREDVPKIPDPIIQHSPVGLIELTIENLGTETEVEGGYYPKQTENLTPVKSSTRLDIKDTVTTPNITKNQQADFTKKEEQEYNIKIINAVESNNIDEAMRLAEKAEEAGSKTARNTFINALQSRH